MRLVAKFFLLFGVLLAAVIVFGLQRGGSDHYLESPAKLNIGLWGKMPEALSIYDYSALNSYKLLRPLHMGLLSINHEIKIYSGVAESWTVDESGKNYVFFLSRSLLFHNGAKLDCRDVKVSFDKLIERKTSSPLAKLIDSYTCLDEFKFQITIAKKSNSFLFALTNIDASILPKDLVDEKQTLVGLGQYQYVESKSEQIVLQRFESSGFLRPWSAREIRFYFF